MALIWSFMDEITLGQLISFNIYLGMLIWPMISFGEFINVLQRGSASADRLDTALAQEADLKDAEAPVHIDVPNVNRDEAVNLYVPDSESSSLERCFLPLGARETLGIVGRTGSGKSTLLKQLLRQYPVDPGKLYHLGCCR